VIHLRPPLQLCVAALCLAVAAHAQDRRKNPTSKIYVADTEGGTQIDTGKKIDELKKKAIYRAEGAIIETKPASNASMVFSNGTGVYFDVNTRVRVREFNQDPFRPNRTDLEDEPSISRMNLHIEYGVIGISTSKLAAGSSMEFDTPLATAFIRGRQSVIQVGDNFTEISMIQGEATVRSGPLDQGHLVKSGQQCIVRAGRGAGAAPVQIQAIQDGNAEEQQQWLYERVLTADAARKLVYFEVQAQIDSGITVFDGDSTDGSGREIVAIPVVPINPPTQPTISAANLVGR
jgi:hypothetical protein